MQRGLIWNLSAPVTAPIFLCRRAKLTSRYPIIAVTSNGGAGRAATPSAMHNSNKWIDARPVLRRLRTALQLLSGIGFSFRVRRRHRQHKVITVVQLTFLDQTLEYIDGRRLVLKSLDRKALRSHYSRSHPTSRLYVFDPPTIISLTAWML